MRSGYPSPSYLRRLPADVVKIDRNLVQLHLEVVAEGVETEEQHAVLGLHAQGYLFGRPQPAGVQQPAAPVSVPLPHTVTTLVARP